MDPEETSAGRESDLPAPRPARSVLFGLPPVGNRYPGAVRVALALAIPAAIATLLGFGSASLLVGLGAFASIYGEGRPYRSRWKAVGIAATALTILSFVGASVGEPVHRAIAGGAPTVLLVFVVLIMAVVVSTCAFTVDALRLGPPGAFFLLLTTEISSVIATPGQPPVEVAMWTAIGGISAVVVSMTGILWAPRAVERTRCTGSRLGRCGVHGRSGDVRPTRTHARQTPRCSTSAARRVAVPLPRRNRRERPPVDP